MIRWQQGFVASLARPGGNITGVSGLGVELRGKRLELLKEAVPRASRASPCCGIRPVPPMHPGSRCMQNLTAAARALGVHLHVVEVRHADELETAFAALPQARADALLVMEDALLLSSRLTADGWRTSPPRAGSPRCIAGESMWTPGASCAYGREPPGDLSRAPPRMWTRS